MIQWVISSVVSGAHSLLQPLATARLGGDEFAILLAA